MTELDDFASLLRDDTPLIDTRAPVEFAKGSLPTAINLPLMTDDEERPSAPATKNKVKRRRCGSATSWSRESVKQSVSRHGRPSHHSIPQARCFVSEGACDRRCPKMAEGCGRGLPPNQGGYKAMRRWLSESTDQLIEHTPLLLLGGPTGAAKTAFSMKATEESLSRGVGSRGVG